MESHEKQSDQIDNLFNHLCTLAAMWRSQIEDRPSIQAEYLDTYNKLRALGWNDAIDWDCELPEENMPKEYVAAFPYVPSKGDWPASWHTSEAIEEINRRRNVKKSLLQKLKEWLK
jgi:hypothetical protein